MKTVAWVGPSSDLKFVALTVVIEAARRGGKCLPLCRKPASCASLRRVEEYLTHAALGHAHGIAGRAGIAVRWASRTAGVRSESYWKLSSARAAIGVWTQRHFGA